MRKRGLSRRQFLKMTGLAGASLCLPWGVSLDKALAAISGGTLNPTNIPKYIMPLIIPPAMPKTPHPDASIDYYEIAVRQFQQQILPTGMPATNVWSYGSVNHPGTFNYPAFTVEAINNKPVRVKWVNQLVDTNGNYLPHLLPVDQTPHWANPGGPVDSRTNNPNPYTGPVPMVPHLHGGHSAEESDGYPEAWFLPAANNIGGFIPEGTWYNAFKKSFKKEFGVKWDAGTATFQYQNDQRAGTLWYHDHSMGMTRLNVYAGPAGFYLIRGGADDLPSGTPGGLPGPAPGVGANPFGTFYEIPLAIQDRSFNDDGSLFYPGTRAFFDGFEGPYIPDSDVPPIWNPEFFGNTMVVNGRTWPYLDVEPRRYRFRILNGCNSRFLILKLSKAVPFWLIGTDGGFLPEPVQLDRLLLGPAERADVIVDFSKFKPGTEITLLNDGPDTPFGGMGFRPADPVTTGQVMRFRVVPLTGPDTSANPALGELTLPAFAPVGSATNTRQVSLNEMMSAQFDIPIAAMLGTVDLANPAAPAGIPKMWDDSITEGVGLNATEVWEIYNFTEDAHPIHIHQIMFQVVSRQPVAGNKVRGPEAWETGLKDTVIAYPGEVTRVRGTFDRPGQYVWHCHIVEHEDNEMMRPYTVG